MSNIKLSKDALTSLIETVLFSVTHDTNHANNRALIFGRWQYDALNPQPEPPGHRRYGVMNPQPEPPGHWRYDAMNPQPEPPGHWRYDAMNPQPEPPGSWQYGAINPVPEPPQYGHVRPQPVPPPSPKILYAAWLAQSVIDKAIDRFQLAQTMGGSDSEERNKDITQSTVTAFTDDLMGVRPWQWSWPPKYDSKQIQSLDLLAAGAQFHKAAITKGALQDTFAKAADRLFEEGIKRLSN